MKELLPLLTLTRCRSEHPQLEVMHGHSQQGVMHGHSRQQVHYAWSLAATGALCMVTHGNRCTMHGHSRQQEHYAWSLAARGALCVVTHGKRCTMHVPSDATHTRPLLMQESQTTATPHTAAELLEWEGQVTVHVTFI